VAFESNFGLSKSDLSLLNNLSGLGPGCFLDKGRICLSNN
jgi:hypothetical protein